MGIYIAKPLKPLGKLGLSLYFGLPPMVAVVRGLGKLTIRWTRQPGKCLDAPRLAQSRLQSEAPGTPRLNAGNEKATLFILYGRVFFFVFGICW